MPEYAIVLYFDEDTENRISQMIHMLADTGLNGYMLKAGIRPHLTLALWQSETEPDIAMLIRRFCDEMGNTVLRFTSLGIFPGNESVLFLAAVKDEALEALHKRLYALIGTDLGLFSPHYLPENWVPHCTLAMKLTEYEAGAAASYALAGFMDTGFPVIATLSEAELIKCEPMDGGLSCESQCSIDF